MGTHRPDIAIGRRDSPGQILQGRVNLDTGGPPCDDHRPPAPASLTKHGADELGTGVSWCGTESVEIQTRPLPDGAEHWGWCVGRALE